jgi:hypothetical protein
MVDSETFASKTKIVEPQQMFQTMILFHNGSTKKKDESKQNAMVFVIC